MAQSKLSFLDSLDKEQLEYAKMVAQAAKAAGVPPALAVSIAYKESSLRPDIKDSEDGAVGLMQVLPKTGKGMNYSLEDLRDPKKNIEAGVKYLKEGLGATDNDPRLTAVYYHSGPDAISDLATGKKLGPRTKEYVTSLKGFGTFDAIEPVQATEASPEAPKPPVAINEPTQSQLAQMKLDKEMADARESAAEQKPMGALTGAGAGLGGAFVKDTKQGVNRLTQSVNQIAKQIGQQGTQMPSTGAPTAPAAPTPVPMGGLPSGDAQTTRILQGTTGDMGTTGRARQTGYNVETSQQAAAKTQAEQIADLLRKSGQVTEDAPTFFAQQPGMTSSPSGVLYNRSSPAPTLGPRGPAGEIGGAKPTVPTMQKMSGLDATKELFVNMMKSAGNVAPTAGEMRDMAVSAGRTLGKLPYISGPLAGASIGYELPELDYGMRVSQPDYTDVGLTAAGMLGTVGSFIPPVAPLAIPMSIGAPMIRDIRRQKQEIERNPEEYRDTIMKSLSNTDPMGTPIP